ncbi:MAG: uroporphyrinogen-III C-methyltransferase [Acidimicrobiia bacterium]|nr:uroporphyrinogen-III C-methyltransferase [Acidimicrobiia bacterium]
MTVAHGRVILIGAGPGAPGLLTVAAMDALRAVDVVLYDRLAGSAFRRYVRPTARLVDVGKQPGRSQDVQDEICARLVSEAKAGRVVARVKGGNPFVFGRGWEEVKVCADNGIPVHVVPGVTSAIAAPTAAGIPLTHRGLTPMFTVVSGHEDPGQDRLPVDWELLGRLGGAIVVLMGVGTVGDYAARLVAGGRRPDTPVVAIENATTPEQAVHRSTLARASADFGHVGLGSPAVVVIGEQAALAESLGPAATSILAPEIAHEGGMTRRLGGWRIAIPRSIARESALAPLLRAEGAVAVEVPVLEFVSPVDPDPLRAAISALRAGRVHEVVVTSAVAADMFVSALFRAGSDVRALAGVSVVAAGPHVATVLRRHGLSADLGDIPPLGVAPHLRLVLALEDEDSGGEQPAGPEAYSPDVEVVPVGRARLHRGPPPRLDEPATLDAVVFMSSRTVAAWADLALPRPPVVACIGPRTRAAADRFGMAPQVVPASPTLPGVVEALAAFASGRVGPPSEPG